MFMFDDYSIRLKYAGLNVKKECFTGLIFKEELLMLRGGDGRFRSLLQNQFNFHLILDVYQNTGQNSLTLNDG